MRNDRSGRLKGVASTDTHLVDDEKGWERRMAATNVEPDGFTMVWLKYGVIGVVDEHEFANLSLVEHLARGGGESTHVGDEPNKEKVFIKPDLVVRTHEYTITRLMLRMVFGMRRDPPMELEV
jgi:hypothetical protein